MEMTVHIYRVAYGYFRCSQVETVDFHRLGSHVLISFDDGADRL